MKKNRKRILVAVLVILTLAAAFAGGYWTARYQYRKTWITITNVTREGGKVEVEKWPEGPLTWK